MKGLGNLIRRNCKLFFKDKGMFFTSLITPVILLVLYTTFLAGIYRDSFRGALPETMAVSASLINATVGGQLVSSLLAVSCVTVAFCSNLLMVQDKVSGARRDLSVTPVKRSTLAIGYFGASALTTLAIDGVGLRSLPAVSGQNGMVPVGRRRASAAVGCGAADAVRGGPVLAVSISSFPPAGRPPRSGTVVSCGLRLYLRGLYADLQLLGRGCRGCCPFCPGTYGTSLLRNHALRGVYAEMEAVGFPSEVIEGIRDSVDCNLYFFGNKVELPAMYAVLAGSVILLTALYVGIHQWKTRRA